MKDLTKFSIYSRRESSTLNVFIKKSLSFKYASEQLRRYSDMLRNEQFGDRIPPVQSGSRAHPDSSAIGTGLLLESSVRGISFTTHPHRTLRLKKDQLYFYCLSVPSWQVIIGFRVGELYMFSLSLEWRKFPSGLFFSVFLFVVYYSLVSFVKISHFRVYIIEA